ncbi:PRC-barrel domain-containing protein [Paraburkholderia sediminicola]|uniref:PRC-barrel domain-containing protein n=1 Tax=Paraburkholderia sediminicola TaxID=458836 RepID=UPI0038B8E875
MMQRTMMVVSAGLLAAALAAGVLAQGTPQAVTEKRVDVVRLATGYRVSKINGAAVFNRNKDRIGTVDDLILAPNGRESAYAILSVGGFLGMGTHLVAVPFGSLQITSQQVMLPDATRDALLALPEFKYAPD